ncbi:MAG: glutamate racemase [Candidatus Omnitrophota bacterium]
MPATKKNHCAIGVFDSGLGGLTVVKELMRQLPHEDIVYFGDTARVPYGTKSKESIIRFSQENVAVLLRHNVKMIVVACNTSSSLAMDVLKENFSLPIIGVIEPGAKKAVSMSQNGRIGIIATPATVNSNAYTKSIKRFNNAIHVAAKACPLFVPLAEEGWFRKRATFDIAQEYLAPIISARVDTLILGCTHYPLLRSVLQKVVGKKVCLVDSAKEVAGEVRLMLKTLRLENSSKHKPQYTFLASDAPQHFGKIAKRFLGYDIKDVRRCSVV